MLNGSTVDYATELIGSSFRITGNPQAKGGCGCGVSWELNDQGSSRHLLENMSHRSVHFLLVFHARLSWCLVDHAPLAHPDRFHAAHTLVHVTHGTRFSFIGHAPHENNGTKGGWLLELRSQSRTIQSFVILFNLNSVAVIPAGA